MALFAGACSSVLTAISQMTSKVQSRTACKMPSSAQPQLYARPGANAAQMTSWAQVLICCKQLCTHQQRRPRASENTQLLGDELTSATVPVCNMRKKDQQTETHLSSMLCCLNTVLCAAAAACLQCTLNKQHSHVKKARLSIPPAGLCGSTVRANSTAITAADGRGRERPD